MGPLIASLGEGDRLIVPEMSRLGRFMLECMEILSIAKQREISLYDIRNGWELNGTIQSKVLPMTFSIAAQIVRDLISRRTKDGLRAAQGARASSWADPRDPANPNPIPIGRRSSAR